MLLLAPMAAGLIRMAISRTREFSADASSARTLGNAQPMIDALAKLDSIGRQIPLDASPSMSHLYITQPFSGRSLSRLFSTHPPLRNGLRRCAECQSTADQCDGIGPYESRTLQVRITSRKKMQF